MPAIVTEIVSKGKITHEGNSGIKGEEEGTIVALGVNVGDWVDVEEGLGFTVGVGIGVRLCEEEVVGPTMLTHIPGGNLMK